MNLKFEILSFITVFIIVASITLIITGCQTTTPMRECDSYTVYAGNTTFTNCTRRFNSCNTDSCIFNDCKELQHGESVHSVEWVRRCS